MAVNPQDILEITCRGEFNGVEDVVNVYQYRYTGASVAADADVISDFETEMESLYTPFVPDQMPTYEYRDITIRNLTQSVIMSVGAWPTLTDGTSAGKANPPGIAGLINMATTIVKVVLRKYLGGFAQSIVDDDGTFTTAFTAKLLVFGLQLILGFSVTVRGYDYGHLSPKTTNFEVPTSASVTDIPAYQRRRKQGRGV